MSDFLFRIWEIVCAKMCSRFFLVPPPSVRKRQYLDSTAVFNLPIHCSCNITLPLHASMPTVVQKLELRELRVLADVTMRVVQVLRKILMHGASSTRACRRTEPCRKGGETPAPKVNTSVRPSLAMESPSTLWIIHKVCSYFQSTHTFYFSTVIYLYFFKRLRPFLFSVEQLFLVIFFPLCL
jgi:hypothetical protein